MKKNIQEILETYISDDKFVGQASDEVYGLIFKIKEDVKDKIVFDKAFLTGYKEFAKDGCVKSKGHQLELERSLGYLKTLYKKL